MGVSIDWAESLEEDVTVGSHPKRPGFVVGSKLHLLQAKVSSVVFWTNDSLVLNVNSGKWPLKF